jgi:hypothetical protein
MRILTFVSASACFLSAYAARIQFDAHIIPQITQELPIFSLGSPAVVPQTLLHQFINNTAPGAQLKSGNGGQYAHDGDRLVALVNETTGETKIFPSFGKLKPSEFINTNLAFEYMKNEQMFPRDDTNFVVTAGSSLLGSTYHNSSSPTPPMTYLAHAWVQRNVAAGNQQYPVCGEGSKASFGFAADGTVHSLSHLWKPAKHTGQTVSSITTDAVYQSINQQLESVTGAGFLTVHNVDVCFYDSGSNFLQPVYRFSATLDANSTNLTNIATAAIQGFIPLGASHPEAVPQLITSTPRPAPANPSPAQPTSNSTISRRQRFNVPIKVGRYIDRNLPGSNYNQWYLNSWNFLDGLRGSQNLFGFNLAEFIDSQYLWAYPYQFTSEKQSYVNNVHIADTEVHGNWHEFWTLYNTGDLVYLSDIPSSGYGPGAGGSLAYWILHSCEVIPTPTDYSAANQHEAWDVWWNVFNGLHAVVGYRTEMWIADTVMGPFGSAIGLGAAVVPTWLQTVHDDTQNYVPVQTDNENPNHIQEPYGRAAAIAVCGHEDDIVIDVENLGRPGCLTMWWYNNQGS